MFMYNRKQNYQCRAPSNYAKVSAGHLSIIRRNYLKYKIKQLAYKILKIRLNSRATEQAPDGTQDASA